MTAGPKTKLVANLVSAIVALILGFLIEDTNRKVSSLDDQLGVIQRVVLSEPTGCSSSSSLGLIPSGDSQNATPASSVRDNSTLLERPSTVTMW